MFSSLDAENSFPDNQTVIGKNSPFTNGLMPILESPTAVVNPPGRRLSSHHSNVLAFSEESDDSESDEADGANNSLVVSTTAMDWKEPEWNSDPPSQLIKSVSNSFELTSEGREYFTSGIKDRKIIVITVCGLYRTGKSYLLNLISGRIGPSPTASVQPLFKTSGSVNACTSGIWIWGSSCLAASPSNEPVYILVDCEGSGNTANTRDHDSRLFAIAMLMSSYFLYNSKGVIDETSLSSLTLVTSLASSVVQNASTLSQKNKPKFMWVLRDFVLALEDLRGAQISPSEYLENTLKSKPYKKTLLQLFSTLDCMTLVTPMTDELKLQKLTDVAWPELRPEFRDQILSLRSKLFRDAKSKKSVADGKEMTSAEFLKVVETTVSVINSNEIPKIETIWKLVQVGETERVVAQLAAEYEARLDSVHLPINSVDLDALLSQRKKEALKKFKTVVGDNQPAIKDELVFNMIAVNKKLVDANETKTKERAELLLRQLWREEVVAVLRSAQAGGDSVIRERIDVLRLKYFSQVVGCDAVVQKVYDDNILPRVEKLLVESQAAAAAPRRQTTDTTDPVARGVPLPDKRKRGCLAGLCAKIMT